MVNTIRLKISDNEKRNNRDKFTIGQRKLRGRVVVHERLVKNKQINKIEDKDNLIVYRGRNWLVQRAFNKSLTNRANWDDRYISWFGIGTGGATADPLIPSSPALYDYELGSHATVDNGTFITVDGNEYHPLDAGYPYFLYDEDIDEGDLPAGCVEPDLILGTDHKCDAFLIGLVQITIAADQCNGTGYQDLSEAGLFTSPSNDPLYAFSSGDVQLFSRVCFSTIRKTDERELIFSWYIYF